jgi:hypothetical protein
MLSMNVADDGAVKLDVSGQVTKSDIDKFEPAFDRVAADQGPVRMIIELTDFEGWDFDGFWRDLKFDSRHQDDLERVAIVGEEGWEDLSVRFTNPFFKADMRFFYKTQREEAERWVRQ